MCESLEVGSRACRLQWLSLIRDDRSLIATSARTIVMLILAILTDTHSAPVEVVIGRSASHNTSSKTLHVQRDGLVCPPIVDQHNWVSGSKSAATFAVSVQGTAVTVQRTDKAKGWIMNLRLPCSYSSGMKAHKCCPFSFFGSHVTH